MMIDALSQLRSFIEPWLPAYVSIGVQALGAFVDGERKLFAGRVTLAPQRTDDSAADVESSALWASSATESFSHERLTRILADLEHGTLKVGQFSCRIPLDPGAQLSARFYGSYHPDVGRQLFSARVPGVIVTGSSRSLITGKLFSTEEAEWHLRAMTPPFSDFPDFFTYAGFERGGYSDGTYLDLRALPPLSLDRASEIQHGMALLRCRASRSLDLKRISVGFRADCPYTKPLRATVAGDCFDWKEHGEQLEGTLQLNLHKASQAHLFLRYDGRAIEDMIILESSRHVNPRFAAHAAFDEDGQRLQSQLVNFKREARSFEDAVAIVLHLRGFTVTQIGHPPKLADAPDILASTPGSKIVLVECTTTMPDEGDQVSKILRRAHLLKETLLESGWPEFEVMPVIACALAEEQVAAIRADIEKKRVGILAQEDLLALAKQARTAPAPDVVFSDLRSRLDRAPWLAALEGNKTQPF